MDREAVIEFLGHVTLLQRLPGSSLRRIADVVQVKHYDAGEYVVRSGESGGGVYFIWEGQAEVSGSVNGEEGNNPELQLGQYDYFGYGTGDCIHQVNVIALSKVDLFRGITLPDAPSFGQVFGGQFIGQALAAASKTVDSLKLVHSLHVFFIVAGDINLPIIYQVQRPRDGKSFATRRVDATQRGTVVFTLLASFQKEESGFEHQEALMPTVPSPEMIPSMEELRERRLTDPRIPMSYRNTVARKKIVPWPIDIRFVESGNSTRQSQPRLNYWFKARGKLSDDPALHRCVVAYASDLIFSGVSLNPHKQKGLKTSSLSLDHSIWFHRPIRADDWLLYTIESPTAFGGRGFVSGRMFNKKGELVASLTQEALIRKSKQQSQAPNPKL